MAKDSVLFALVLCICAAAAIDIENDTALSGEMMYMNYKGDMVCVTEDLMRKLEEEQVTWHWTPWQRTRTKVHDNEIVEVTCIGQNSIDSFPDSIFSDDQLRRGGFILFVLFGMVSFTQLAIVCNDYFIPCVELICEDLKIPQNVAAATFMAVATSCPEFFVNMISTFITESPMGIGTVMGSAIFNLLGVAAIGSLAAVTPIAIEWQPVTRDVLIYMVNVTTLLLILWDSQVEWYEAMTLAIMYILYFIIMFNSVRIFKLIKYLYGKCCKPNKTLEVNGTKHVEEGIDNKAFDEHENNNTAKSPPEIEEVETSCVKGIFAYPKGESVWAQMWWWYTLPIRFLLGITIPSPITCRTFYPFAFFMCIVWIGVNSYVVSWCMTVLGHIFFIPDSVMGMTFLAFGGCIPEASSIFIMSRRGEGGVGVSNALGANSLAILFALGLPWLIRTLTLMGQGADQTVVFIDSTGITFIVGTLLIAVACLWICLFIAKFKLQKRLGAVLAVLYVLFITIAVLIEVGVIFDTLMMAFCV